MFALTPSERRGAVVVVFILALGAARDLWMASAPEWTSPPFDTPPQAAAREGRVDPATLPPEPGSKASVPGPDANRPGPIDLNRAGERELDALPGIGPVLAARIVAHRRRFGDFRRVEELLGVPGIGPRLFARLEPHIRLGLADSSANRTRPRAGHMQISLQPPAPTDR